ncbi:hypothetical protein OGAPHI_001248 [Ogataea philodendri]|uniref:Secreted protein n=1 Tax=Ogataea philodendri TaxID=1378263 RepID=A0A9P8PEE0_9ASCO|nr:uncharacterized protein OGAPHI_001248 [Ogataea philodendri]KAH3670733.1 hypothetical protein OGAPHI_001248 [Ogataea philodendri]
MSTRFSMVIISLAEMSLRVTAFRMSSKYCHTDASELKFWISSTTRSPRRTIARSLMDGERNLDRILSTSSSPEVPEAGSRYDMMNWDDLASRPLNTSDDDCRVSSSSQLRMRLQISGNRNWNTSWGIWESWLGPLMNTVSTCNERSSSGEYWPLESAIILSNGSRPL